MCPEHLANLDAGMTKIRIFILLGERKAHASLRGVDL
jgi:hypothetical protein